MTATHDSRNLSKDLDGEEDTADSVKRRLKAKADELVENGQEALGNLGTKVRGQVRDRPLTSLVVAGGIGLLLGMLIARKR